LQTARDAIAEAELMQTMIRDANKALARQEQAWRDIVLSLVVEHTEDDAWREQMSGRIERIQEGLDVVYLRHQLLKAQAERAGQRLRGETLPPTMPF